MPTLELQLCFELSHFYLEADELFDAYIITSFHVVFKVVCISAPVITCHLRFFRLEGDSELLLLSLLLGGHLQRGRGQWTDELHDVIDLLVVVGVVDFFTLLIPIGSSAVVVEVVIVIEQ